LPAISTDFILEWFDLSAPEEIHSAPTGDRTSSDFAFSPNGERLAYHGCMSDGECGVRLLDPASQEDAILYPIEKAGRFAWSPDGTELAFLGSGGPAFEDREWRLVVLDIERGTPLYVTYFSPDMGSEAVTADAPTWVWRQRYPPEQPGLGGCLGRMRDEDSG
jgi:hypothetical protein